MKLLYLGMVAQRILHIHQRGVRQTTIAKADSVRVTQIIIMSPHVPQVVKRDTSMILGRKHVYCARHIIQ